MLVMGGSKGQPTQAALAPGGGPRGTSAQEGGSGDDPILRTTLRKPLSSLSSLLQSGGGSPSRPSSSAARASLGCGAPSRVYYDDLEGGSTQSDRSSGGGGDGMTTGDAPAEAQEDAPEDASAEGAPPADTGADAGDGAAVDGETPDGAASDGAHDAGPDVFVDSGCGPLNTVTNCGACGNACDTTHSIGASCDGTSCQYNGLHREPHRLQPGLPLDLDGCETPTNTTTNCGGCGVACDTVTSAGVSCNGTTCQYSGCAGGYADCDTTPPNANGCETIFTNNPLYCGGCGHACDTTNSTGATCSNSQCHYIRLRLGLRRLHERRARSQRVRDLDEPRPRAAAAAAWRATR